MQLTGRNELRPYTILSGCPLNATPLRIVLKPHFVTY